MLTAEHTHTAHEFQERAIREFASGNRLIASEILWGAVAHAVMAIATENGWPKGSHGAFRSAVRRLSRERNDPVLTTFFDSAEKLPENFYHNNLNPTGITLRREQAQRLIPRLLALLG